jgi:hypothetical protein
MSAGTEPHPFRQYEGLAAGQVELAEAGQVTGGDAEDIGTVLGTGPGLVSLLSTVEVPHVPGARDGVRELVEQAPADVAFEDGAKRIEVPVVIAEARAGPVRAPRRKRDAFGLVVGGMVNA